MRMRSLGAPALQQTVIEQTMRVTVQLMDKARRRTCD